MARNHPLLSAEALEEAIANAAHCKATRAHRLEVIPSDPARRPLFGALITYRCELCGTLRLDNVSRLTGQVLARQYDPPDWYAAANVGSHDPSWWRATWWDQLDNEMFLDAEPSGKARKAGAVTPIQRRKRA